MSEGINRQEFLAAIPLALGAAAAIPVIKDAQPVTPTAQGVPAKPTLLGQSLEQREALK